MGGCGVLTVRVLLELGKLGGAERDPPAIAHLWVAGPKAGATSHCAHRARLGVSVPSRPLGHIGTARGAGGSRPAGIILLSPWAAKPRSFRAQHLPP